MFCLSRRILFVSSVSLPHSLQFTLWKRANHGSTPIRRQVKRAAATISNSTTVSHHQAAHKIWLPSENDTYNLGKILASDVRPSDVLLLHGQLGAGKTSVARGYIHTARQDPLLQVTSPTYLLANAYPAQQSEQHAAPTVYHLDLWRLDDASSRPIVDFDHVFRSAASLIEWPDRLKSLVPPDCLDVILEYPDPQPTQLSESDTDNDDPWGFGTGEPDDPTSARSGRYAYLVPHGPMWHTRIRTLYQHHIRHQANDQSSVTLQS